MFGKAGGSVADVPRLPRENNRYSKEQPLSHLTRKERTDKPVYDRATTSEP